MGHNVSSTKVVVKPNSSGFNDIKHTENGINSSAGLNHVTENRSSVRIFNKDKEFNVKVDNDNRLCDITGCCITTDGCLVLSDFTNKRLKKVSPKGLVTYIDLPEQPSDVCCIGKNDNKVVVCGGNSLYFVNSKGSMKITRSVTLSHKCNGVTHCGGKLYVIDDSSIMKYASNGGEKELLYTGSTSSSAFCHIATNENGTKLYVTDERSGLRTFDSSSGAILATLTDSGLKKAQGLCVDSEGNVLVSDFESDNVIKVDSCGQEKLGTVIQDGGDIRDPKCLCMNNQASKLYVGQWDDKLTVFDAK
jgi:sugar lactone lactonase YvrE